MTKSSKKIKKTVKTRKIKTKPKHNKRKTYKSKQLGGVGGNDNDNDNDNNNDNGGNGGYSTLENVSLNESESTSLLSSSPLPPPSLPQSSPLTPEQEQQEVINARKTGVNGDNFSSGHVREQKRINRLEKECKEKGLVLSQNNNANWICIQPNTVSSRLKVNAKPPENIFGELGQPQPPEITPFADRCTKELGKVWGKKSDGSWGCVYGHKSFFEKCQQIDKVYGQTQNGNWGCIDNQSSA